MAGIGAVRGQVRLTLSGLHQQSALVRAKTLDPQVQHLHDYNQAYTGTCGAGLIIGHRQVQFDRQVQF